MFHLAVAKETHQRLTLSPRQKLSEAEPLFPDGGVRFILPIA
jgi:hypothetical protein